MARRKRINRFKKGRIYWILTANIIRPGNPNVYMETYTTQYRWTTAMNSVADEPRVFYTKKDAETAAILIGAKFPDRLGRMEVIQYSRSVDFWQEAL